jgi:hypothetical protein
LTVSNSYVNYWQIQPWDTCKIRNSKIVFPDDLVISQIRYTQEEAILTIGDNENFISLLENQNE